jgi:hypothetical protein
VAHIATSVLQKVKWAENVQATTWYTFTEINENWSNNGK